MAKYSNSTYTFRGLINLTHLTNDCIKDGKSAFISIGETAMLGISRQVNLNSLQKWKNFVKPTVVRNSTPFHIFLFDKRHISFTMNFAKKLPCTIKRDINRVRKDLAKDRKKGKFSNQPETKIMVY